MVQRVSARIAGGIGWYGWRGLVLVTNGKRGVRAVSLPHHAIPHPAGARSGEGPAGGVLLFSALAGVAPLKRRKTVAA